MNNNQLAEAAKILGVSEDSISAMDDEIKNSMTAVFEQVAVKNDEDKKAVTILSHPWWYTEITARERPKPNNKKQFKEESIMTNTSQSLCAIR